MGGITQQAVQFAFQYMIENHYITLLLLFRIDCKLHVSLDYLQKLYFKCSMDLLISVIALDCDSGSDEKYVLKEDNISQ